MVLIGPISKARCGKAIITEFAFNGHIDLSWLKSSHMQDDISLDRYFFKLVPVLILLIYTISLRCNKLII